MSEQHTPVGYVTSKSSFQRPDGGYDTIELTLLTDASDEEIAQAIDTWTRMRGASHAAYQAVQPRSAVAASASEPSQGGLPICKYHGQMKESTKVPGTYFCTKKLADGSYCKERA